MDIKPERKEISMYKCKYIFGQTIKYQGKNHKVNGIRFTPRGIMYKLSKISEWIKEEDVYANK